MKKTWQTPKLITLVRSTPDEAVLDGCKTDSTGFGPASGAADCSYNLNSVCGICSATVDS